MTITVAALLAALATFVLGLYLGHRWGSHDASVEANDHQRRFRRLLRFAEPYIDANAEARHWSVERNEAGGIIDIHDPPIRCGTSALAAKATIEEVRQRNTPR